MNSILAKDFIETAELLVFAVIENGLEQGKVLCFLRYINADGQWKKVNTEKANQFLADNYPRYLYYSKAKQAHCHALTLAEISKHHQPRIRLKQLLATGEADSIERDCVSLCLLFQKNGLNLDEVGITGSVLISAQKQSSDIDFVFYSRGVFEQARRITQQLIVQDNCSELTDDDWHESYNRRSCDLSYSEYVWHEKRKFNKGMINKRKFDLSLVVKDEPGDNQIAYKKIEAIKLTVQIADDSLSFDYPAEFAIKHPQIKTIVCYTATYTGQAKIGEWVEVAGVVEQAADGGRRIVVGSSREAPGEYIKVIDA